MFTPQEVSEKVFPKASGFGGGYQMASVDTFLDSLTEDYTALYKENMTLKAKLKILAEKVEEYRATEDSMRATLLTAQKMAAKLVQEAQEEKDSMVAQARIDAAAEITALEQKTQQAQQRLALAEQSLGEFLNRVRELTAQQQAYIDALPEAVLCNDVLPSEEKPVAEDIGAGILKAFAAAEPMKEELPDLSVMPAEEKEEDHDNTIVFDRDFKLSLDELKFGRNFSDDE